MQAASSRRRAFLKRGDAPPDTSALVGEHATTISCGLILHRAASRSGPRFRLICVYPRAAKAAAAEALPRVAPG